MCDPSDKPEAPTQLDSQLILNQREHKYLLDAHAAFSFWEIASSRLQPHGRDTSRPLCYVRTTYFDTHDFAYYRGSSSKLARRLRVREYASASVPDEVPELTGVCVLELKQSASGKRSKSRVHLAPEDVDAYLASWAAANHDTPLAPCLTTWYQRVALTDAADRLRVTLDARVRFCAPTPVGSPCAAIDPPDVLAYGPAFVLEIKLWDEPPSWLQRAMRGLREAVGFSKFEVGMRAAEECGLIRSTRETASTDGAWPAESLGA